MKNIARMVQNVVDLKMLRQDRSIQRLDGVDKTWSLQKLEHLSLVQLELKKVDPR